MEALEIEQAIELLTTAERSADVSATERLEVLVLLVECNLTLENADAAKAAATRIYALDPGFRPPQARTPMRVLRLLEEVRAMRPAPVAVEVGQPRLVRDASGLELALPMSGEVGAVHRVLVRLSQAARERTFVASRTDGGFRTALGALEPGAELRAAIEVLSPSGAMLASLGPVTLVTPNGNAPSRRRVTRREESGSVLASPWFWLAAGGVAVAIGVVAFVLLSGDDSCQESTEPGGRLCLR
jgi:hypothetical protein